MEAITSSVKSAFNSGMSVFSSISSNAILGLVAVIVVAVLCAALIYWLIVDNVFQKRSMLVPETKTPLNGKVTSVIPIDYMPQSHNGLRRTMTFWIYLNDMNNGNGQYKRVFHVGSNNEDINTLSPIVFLGKHKNELYIRYSKMKDENGPSGSSIQLSDDNMNTFMKQGAILEYLPMQRWVHIGVVVTENISGGVMHVYVDSDLAIVSGDNDKFTGVDMSSDNTKSINNLSLDKIGNLVVGSDGRTTNDIGFNGLISKITFWNYDLNARDIYNNYSEGPIDGLFASLGYGLRSPIYKLSNA